MRTLAAIILIVVGSIGTLCFGFLALFTVGAITSNAEGVGSQIGALLVTATPVLCGAAAWCGFVALTALADRANTALRTTQRALGGGAALSGLAMLFLTIGGPMTRLS
ncbi:hypothetical protein U1872_20760 [Sphingomonas sp. RB3P16]|uniref:hypothetical protein n=1 Tax=Parasphingomonas frigoris TaxID=3096163 RepID=UPI002FCB0742